MEQRGSDKHGPRLDDELDKEDQSFEKGQPVDSRVEPFRQMEEVAVEEEPEEPPPGGAP